MSSSQNCLFPHDPTTGKSPILGLWPIPYNPSSRPIPELMGLSGQGLMDKMKRDHRYMFIMGGGQSTPNYRDAEDKLLLRNMPDIYWDRKQTHAIFIPETYLPKCPRVVDEDEYEKKTRYSQ